MGLEKSVKRAPVPVRYRLGGPIGGREEPLQQANSETPTVV